MPTPEALPKPIWTPGRRPCGECHLQLGEICDICGAEMSKQLIGQPLEQVLHIDCPRAKSDMTPCVLRDGELAVDDRGCCVGCGERIGLQTGGGGTPRRHLTRDEVRIMDKALLASSTLIHAGELAGGGDAPLIIPEMEPACVITIELHANEAERASEIYEALEGLLWKMGDIGLLGMTCGRTPKEPIYK